MSSIRLLLNSKSIVIYFGFLICLLYISFCIGKPSNKTFPQISSYYHVSKKHAFFLQTTLKKNIQIEQLEITEILKRPEDPKDSKTEKA